MKKKHLLILNKLYFPHKGGVETAVNEHASWLSKFENYEVKVLVSDEKKLNFANQYINKENFNVIKTFQIFTLFSMPISFSYFTVFFKHIKKTDILFLHEPWPLGTMCLFLANLFLRKKFSSIIFWHADTKKINFIDKILFYFQRKNLNNAKFIFVTNKLVLQNSQIKNLPNLKSKLVELPIPISFNSKEEETISKDIQDIDKIKKSKSLFFFFGRLVKYKGVEFLIKAFPKIKKNKIILIAGEGPLSNMIKGSIKGYENIIFIDRFLSEDEKVFVFKKATAFLFPSINESESLGITQIEALSLGCPVINTNIKTAVPFVSLNNITGKTINAGNYKELSRTINCFPKKNSEDWRQLSINCKKRYNNFFSRDKFEKKFSATLKKLD